uniref:CHCH domain-containing protein n=1 Tax=Arcella intermedia TaxID=1963864 RepID=A0A6B2LV83_9EUKA
MNLAKNKVNTPIPPEKGSFPLDHFGECKTETKEYMACLAVNEGVHRNCEELAKIYIACRMDRGLMAKEPLENLGFKK